MTQALGQINGKLLRMSLGRRLGSAAKHPNSIAALILGLAASVPALAWGQASAPENPLRVEGAPRALLPFMEMAASAEAKGSAKQRGLLPYIKLRTSRPLVNEADRIPTTTEPVQQVANNEPGEDSEFNRSRAKSYKIEDDSSDVAASGDARGEANSLRSSRKKPVTLRISDGDKTEEASEADDYRAEPEFATDREALSSLVKFGPQKTSEATPVRARPALIARAQPNGLRSGDTVQGEEIPQIPAPNAEGNLEDEPEKLPEGRKSDFKSIAELRVDIGPKDKDLAPGQRKLPDNSATAYFGDVKPVYQSVGYRREWAQSGYAWVAPGLCHNPLYFEEVSLERNGLSFGLIQPGVSFLSFYGKLIILPYQMAATPPRECVYTLGHYRPGSYAPFQLHYPPPSAKGAFAEAVTIAALIFIMP